MMHEWTVDTNGRGRTQVLSMSSAQVAVFDEEPTTTG
jgi:hypothetical protein